VFLLLWLPFLPRYVVCCIDYHVYTNVRTFSNMFLSYTCVHPFSQVTRIVQTTLLFCSSIWTYTISCTRANNSQVHTVRYLINIIYRILSLINIKNCTYTLIQLFCHPLVLQCSRNIRIKSRQSNATQFNK
jgi:hypothetical protein